MAYQGWLIKVGSYVINSAKYIRAESYNVTKTISDLDPYRDADGILHRNALAHQPIKVEFETPPMLTNADVAVLMAGIKANFTVPLERKAEVTVYIPEDDEYITQEMYMPDIKFTMYGNYHGRIQYQPIRLAFIGY